MRNLLLIFGAIGILILVFAIRRRQEERIYEPVEDEIHFELYAQ